LLDPSGASHASAWYFTFTTIKPIQVPDQDYTQLAFADEFNSDGAPDSSKWSLETGTGNGGWGNLEKQTYTTSPSNVTVQGGSLKITAKRESVGGAEFTSARLKSENKFAFTYGKVEVRAKLPIGGGTWPAIWMLGKNYPTQTWPACGEIDIMEMVGNNPNKVFASLHYPGRSGGSSVTNTTTVQTASTEFHVYKTVWTPNYIKFYVDNVLFHSFSNQSTLPFNNDFFLILNVAMGGNFGGAIDSAFNQSTMEIDYVRVYR
jgi:beta-glucanase (GH16 family)